jgi:hypothetical protein
VAAEQLAPNGKAQRQKFLPTEKRIYRLATCGSNLFAFSFFPRKANP